RQQIQQATEKRCETLSTHPKHAINSILNRYKAPIHFSNIKLPDQIVTDPTLFNNLWSAQYQPLSHINTQWYDSLSSPITEEEVTQTIAKLPNGKACGPTGISYEMLKHASTTY